MSVSVYNIESGNTIVVGVPGDVPSRDWQRVASKRARRAVEEAGLNWVDANVVVHLPEAGRMFHKPAGALGLGAQG